jgi:hypothetical protein
MVLQFDQHYWEECRSEKFEQKLRNQIVKDSKGKEKEKDNNSGTKKKKSKKSQDSSNSNSNNSNNSNKKSSDNSSTLKTKNDISKNLGSDGKLLPAVRQHRMDNGLCLFCGVKGHMAAECSKRKKDPAKGRAAKASTSATETTEAKPASAVSKN